MLIWRHVLHKETSSVKTLPGFSLGKSVRSNKEKNQLWSNKQKKQRMCCSFYKYLPMAGSHAIWYQSTGLERTALFVTMKSRWPSPTISSHKHVILATHSSSLGIFRPRWVDLSNGRFLVSHFAEVVWSVNKKLKEKYGQLFFPIGAFLFASVHPSC